MSRHPTLFYNEVIRQYRSKDEWDEGDASELFTAEFHYYDMEERV
jgi:hypothetical protein